MSNEFSSRVTVSASELLAKIAKRREEREAAPVRQRTTSGQSVQETNPMQAKFQKLVVPDRPVMLAAPDAEGIRRILQPAIDLRRLTPIAPIPRHMLDPRQPSKKKLNNFTSNIMDFRHWPKAGSFISWVKNAYQGVGVTDEEMLALLLAMREAEGYIGSGGTLLGLMTRLVKGLTSAPHMVPFDDNFSSQCVVWAKSVVQYNDIDYNFYDQSVVDIIIGVDIPINYVSDAGCPYFTKVEEDETFANALSISAELFKLIAEGGSQYKNRMKREQALLTVLLKNKTDYYHVTKLATKVRPYYVYPLHERLMYFCLHHFLKPIPFTLRHYTHEEYSGSAVGFTWNYGGAHELYSRIEDYYSDGAELKKYGFFPIFYGDDQLWIFVLPFGTYVIDPDFEHMDMSLHSSYGDVAREVWGSSFKKIDKTWREILAMNCRRAFVHPVIIEGGLAYKKSFGLSSGVVGTTKFDEIVSASINGFIKVHSRQFVEKSSKLEHLETYLANLKTQIFELFGLNIKEGTANIHQFLPDQDHYTFEFLGQNLVLHQTGIPGVRKYVPRPKLERLVIAATTFKKKYTSNNLRDRAEVTKLRSLATMGGYHYRAFWERTQTYFENQAKRRIHPLRGGEDEDGEQQEESVFMQATFPDDDWPTYAWCVNLFLPHDCQLVDTSTAVDSSHAGHELGLSTDTESESGSSASFVSASDLSPPKTTMSDRLKKLELDTWSGKARYERPMFEDVGDAEEPPMPEVPAATTGKQQKLPDAVKRKFERERAAEREARKLVRPPKGGPSSSGAKGKTAAKIPKRQRAAVHGSRTGAVSGAEYEYHMAEQDFEDSD